MSDHQSNPGPDPSAQADKAQMEQEAARAKQQAARAEAEAKEAQRTAEAEEEKHKEHSGKPAETKPDSTAEPKAEKVEEKPATKPKKIVPKQKPELDDDMKEALELRDAKSRKRPAFRRQEWFRYKKLGGKDAGWRSPRGMHSKARRHYKYRPNVVSIGYRGPAAARGLHPSGFEEVLVHRPEDLAAIEPKTQAARVGGTVGGRKAELIEKKADELGIRVLNRRS